MLLVLLYILVSTSVLTCTMSGLQSIHSVECSLLAFQMKPSNVESLPIPMLVSVPLQYKHAPWYSFVDKPHLWPSFLPLLWAWLGIVYIPPIKSLTSNLWYLMEYIHYVLCVCCMHVHISACSSIRVHGSLCVYILYSLTQYYQCACNCACVFVPAALSVATQYNHYIQ